jgi:hypothetical protein
LGRGKIEPVTWEADEAQGGAVDLDPVSDPCQTVRGELSGQDEVSPLETNRDTATRDARRATPAGPTALTGGAAVVQCVRPGRQKCPRVVLENRPRREVGERAACPDSDADAPL